MLVIQSCLTLCDPMDCSPPDSSVREILQARILEGVAFPFSRESSQPMDQTCVSCIAGRFFTFWAPGRPPTKFRSKISLNKCRLQSKGYIYNWVDTDRKCLVEYKREAICFSKQWLKCFWGCPQNNVDFVTHKKLPTDILITLKIYKGIFHTYHLTSEPCWYSINGNLFSDEEYKTKKRKMTQTT